MAYGHRKPRTSKNNSKQEFGAARAPRGPGRVGRGSGGTGAKPAPMPTRRTNRQDFGPARAPRGPGRVGQGGGGDVGPDPQPTDKNKMPQRAPRGPQRYGKHPRSGRIPGGMKKRTHGGGGKQPAINKGGTVRTNKYNVGR